MIIRWDGRSDIFVVKQGITSTTTTIHRCGITKEEKTVTDIPHYSMHIQWSDADQAYIVTVPELPGCRTHGHTYEEAVQQAQDAIESWVMVALGDNQPLPPPRYYASDDDDEE
jgi:predicted RNase H-like HicB family nuclease